jgi:hypothetical protein
MRRLLLACAFLLLAGPAFAQRDGIYDVRGTNLDGTEYTGLAQIRALGVSSFAIIWRLGDQVVQGVGIASGRTVSVAYGLSQRPGMGIYTLNPDGSMEGEWTIIGAPSTGRERLTPRPADPADAAPPDTPPGAPPPPAATPSPPAPPAQPGR